MSAYALSEIERMLSNLIRIGTIAELDEANALATVDVAGLRTDWRPWMTTRAGADRSWWAPEPGEQVVLLSPAGDLGQAVILPAIFSTSNAAPAAARTVHRTVYQDGTLVEYDRAAHHLTATLAAGGRVTINAATVDVHCESALVDASSSVTVDTPDATFTGNVLVQRHLRFLGGLSGVAGDFEGGRAAAIVGPIAVESGDITVSGGDVRADGIGLKTHVHGNSGPPSG